MYTYYFNGLSRISYWLDQGIEAAPFQLDGNGCGNGVETFLRTVA